MITDFEDLSKDELVKKCEELQREKEDLEFENESLSSDAEYYENLSNSAMFAVEELENMKRNGAIFNLDLFKQKLELYGLASDELLNFIDTYNKLYNS